MLLDAEKGLLYFILASGKGAQAKSLSKARTDAFDVVTDIVKLLGKRPVPLPHLYTLIDYEN